MEGLLVLAVILLLITLIGHGIWVFLRWIIRQLAGKSAAESRVQTLGLSRCSRCNATISAQTTFCGYCGASKPSGIVVELLKDLAATERQLERFRRTGAIANDVYEDLKSRIQAERIRLGNRESGGSDRACTSCFRAVVVRQQPASVTDSPNDETAPLRSSVGYRLRDAPWVLKSKSAVLAEEHVSRASGPANDRQKLPLRLPLPSRESHSLKCSRLSWSRAIFAGAKLSVAY